MCKGISERLQPPQFCTRNGTMSYVEGKKRSIMKKTNFDQFLSACKKMPNIMVNLNCKLFFLYRYEKERFFFNRNKYKCISFTLY